VSAVVGYRIVADRLEVLCLLAAPAAAAMLFTPSNPTRRHGGWAAIWATIKVRLRGFPAGYKS